MKRNLVTGAAGFIGANLARRLLGDGHEVHVLVRPSSDLWRIKDVENSLHVHEVSLTDEFGLRQLAHRIQPQWIFHLAAYGSYSWQADTKRILETNIMGTVNLVTALLDVGFEAFINTGSSSEYGYKNHPPAEDEIPEPNSMYAVAKTSATLFCRSMAQQHKVRIPTLRVYNIYGPFEEPNRLIPALILNGLQGRLPPLVNPDIARDLVYIEDICDAFLSTAKAELQDPGAVYNVGTGKQLTILEIVEITRRVMNIREEPKWKSMPNRRWDTATWVSNSEKIERELGWKPAHDFEAGFRKTVDWFRTHPEMEALYREKYVPAQ